MLRRQDYMRSYSLVVSSLLLAGSAFSQNQIFGNAGPDSWYFTNMLNTVSNYSRGISNLTANLNSYVSAMSNYSFTVSNSMYNQSVYSTAVSNFVFGISNNTFNTGTAINTTSNSVTTVSNSLSGVASYTVTNLSFTVTNFTLNTVMTNQSGRDMTYYATAFLTAVNAAGKAELGAYNDVNGFGSYTNIYRVMMTTTNSGTQNGTNAFALDVYWKNGSRLYFSNSSSGSGNSASIQQGRLVK